VAGDSEAGVVCLHEQYEQIRGLLVTLATDLARWKTADAKARGKLLADLRVLLLALQALRHRCYQEELDSVFFSLFDAATLDGLRRDHALLEQLSDSFEEELMRARPCLPSIGLVTLGNLLLDHVRAHLLLEEGLLAQAEESRGTRRNRPLHRVA
jgi:hypothetical protein